jgi:hypothetical protein
VGSGERAEELRANAGNAEVEPKLLWDDDVPAKSIAFGD